MFSLLKFLFKNFFFSSFVSFFSRVKTFFKAQFFQTHFFPKNMEKYLFNIIKHPSSSRSRYSSRKKKNKTFRNVDRDKKTFWNDNFLNYITPPLPFRARPQ